LGDTVTIRAFGVLTPLENALIKAGDQDFVAEIRRHLFRAGMVIWRAEFADFGLEIAAATALMDVERNVRTLVFKIAEA
jgi:hypothetical protein